MFGAGWGIPLSPLTLMVTVGGPTTRVVVVDGRVENREYLPLMLSFDHSGDRRSTCRSFRQQVPESAGDRSRRARRETPHPSSLAYGSGPVSY
jgi:hypothetical protein